MTTTAFMVVLVILIFVTAWLTVLQPLLVSFKVTHYVLKAAKRNKGPNIRHTDSGGLAIKIRHSNFFIDPGAHAKLLRSIAKNLCKELSYEIGIAEIGETETVFLFENAR